MELRRQREAMAELRKIIKAPATVTLVFATWDEQHNTAVALKSYLQ